MIRTGGAPHLRSPALMMPWYQKMYLDLLVVIMAVLYATKLIFNKFFNLLCKKETKSQKKTN